MWVVPAFVPLCSLGLVEMGLDGLMAPVRGLGAAWAGYCSCCSLSGLLCGGKLYHIT